MLLGWNGWASSAESYGTTPDSEICARLQGTWTIMSLDSIQPSFPLLTHQPESVLEMLFIPCLAIQY